MAGTAGKPRRLTPKQFAILKFIRNFMAANGQAPSRQEIADEFGFKSVNASEQHLRALSRKGLVTLTPGRARGIALGDAAMSLSSAQETRPPDEGDSRGLGIPTRFFGQQPDDFYRCPDGSMAAAGIREGDLIALVTQGPAPDDGAYVLVRKDGRVCLRTVARKDSQIILADPATGAEEPLPEAGGDDRLIGAVLGLLRRFG